MRTEWQRSSPPLRSLGATSLFSTKAPEATPGANGNDQDRSPFVLLRHKQKQNLESLHGGNGLLDKLLHLYGEHLMARAARVGWRGSLAFADTCGTLDIGSCCERIDGALERHQFRLRGGLFSIESTELLSQIA